LELKLVAEVGLVGYPNAGKSTLLSYLTKAQPKIADYPFTTLTPNLGLAKLQDYRTFVIADIPGLVKGAHRGKGLGHRFLRHIQRTKLLLFLIDSTSENPALQLAELKQELEMYDPGLLRKPHLVALNKIDLLQESHKIKPALNQRNCLYISALTGQGVQNLLNKLSGHLEEIKDDK
jgi:GTP-binding protein